MLCCVVCSALTPLIFTPLKFFVLCLRGMKVEMDITSHGLMKITNASYDVHKITVNKVQIENEISWQRRSRLWILKGRCEMQVCKMQGCRQKLKIPGLHACLLISFKMFTSTAQIYNYANNHNDNHEYHFTFLLIWLIDSGSQHWGMLQRPRARGECPLKNIYCGLLIL